MEFVITKTRNGQSSSRFDHQSYSSKEDAIYALYGMFFSFVNEKMFHNLHGEVVDAEEGITFDGESGWYDCDATLQFRDCDYPADVAGWVSRGINGFEHDVFRFEIESREITEEDCE